MARKSGTRAQAQVVVHQTTGQILCTAFAKGCVHDFRLFKQDRVPLLPEQLCLTDKSYQGIAKLHPHSCTPTRKPPKQTLPDSERQHNRQLAKQRITVKHSIRHLKIFRILSERYHNRRK